GAATDAGIPEADAGLTAGDGGVCVQTNADIEGPFYRADAPFRTQLAAANEPGERLTVRGIVYAPDCVTPLAGVVVDVWHANAAGHYDNDGSPNPDPSAYLLRGRMQTGADGVYEYETVIPGRYLNG